MRPIVFFIAIVISLLASSVQAQFGRKATISGFVGTMVTGNEKVNTSSTTSQDIFGSYKPGIVVGGALFYNVTKLLAVGARARYVNTSKTDYSINQFTIGVDGKFNFLPSDKKLSPYIVAEANLSLTGVNQTANVTPTNPASSIYDPGGNPKYITVTQVDTYYPTASVSFVPLLGYAAGAGLDIRVSEAVGAFVQVDYSSSLAKNQGTIKKYFPNNTSNFSYILISAGLKFNLFKSTSLY